MLACFYLFLLLGFFFFLYWEEDKTFWNTLQCSLLPPKVGQSHYCHMLNQQVKLGLIVSQQPENLHRSGQHGSHAQAAATSC